MLRIRLIPAAILAALLVLPPSAAADGWSVHTIAVEPPSGRALLAHGAWRTSAPVRAPGGFRAVGLLWDGAAAPAFEVRTARARGRFGPWRELGAADAGAQRAPGAARASEPLWVGRAERVQIRARGSVRNLRVVVIDPGPDPRRTARPLVARSTDTGGVPQPAIVSRAAWGADESLRGSPRFAPVLRYAVVHHTAGSNDYSQADAPAVVRSIYLYHARTLAWNDIGYQFLVDRFGTIYEGRAGGITRPVIGAHVYGFNTGSVGVSVLGNLETAVPTPAALDAVARLLAWRLDVAHVDPLSRVRVVSGGGDRYPSGSVVDAPAIAAHRDYGKTACPGTNLYAQLDALRAAAAAVPGLRIWDPRPAAVDPVFADGPVRVTARLSAAAPWRVLILDAAGATVAEGSGSGSVVDYTWPGAAGRSTADLTYRIEAGAAAAAARAATGRLDGRDLESSDIPSEPLAGFTTRPRVLTPNGDGSGDLARIGWNQGVSARVSLFLDTADGIPVTAIDVGGDRGPGAQEIVWAGTQPTGAPLPSGRYRYRLVLEQPGLSPIVQTAPVDVRRGVGALSVTRFVSPGGRGLAERAAISFDRLEPGPVRVRITRGAATVATLADLPDASGPQAFEWDGTGLPDGLYRVQVQAPGPGGTLVLAAKVTLDRTTPRAQAVSVRRRGKRVVRVTLRFSERVSWRLQSRGAVLRRGERAGRIRFDLPRRRLGRIATVYLRDRAGNVGQPLRIRIPG